jgi:hypothetical protein
MRYLAFLMLVSMPSDWQFRVVQSEFSVVTNEFEKVEYPDHLVMYTADYCAPCRVWKDSAACSRLKKEGVLIKFLDVMEDKERLKFAEKLPTFYVVDGKTNKVRTWTKHVGSDLTYEKAMSLFKLPEKAPDAPAEKKVEIRPSGFYNNSYYNGTYGSSHQSRDTLIMHLLQGEVHRGKYTTQYLMSLSDEALCNLHDKDHP